MQIGGIIKQSLVDYPGQIAAVLFTSGCNFRCPYCHNGHLLIRPGKTAKTNLEINSLIDFLQERKGFLDAVVISGGEPTLNSGLPEFCTIVKEQGFLVKLDTNGTNPAMLTHLIENKCLDYIAMDVKGPLDYTRYAQAAGRMSSENFLKVINTIHLLKRAPLEVEFRTTVVPGLITPEDVVEIAKYLQGADVYSIQQFMPGKTLDLEYEKVIPYTKEDLEKMAESCRPFIKEVKVVNT